MAKNSKNNKSVFNSGKYNIDVIFKDIAASITSFFIFFILAIFPLFTHDAYFDILSARYVLYKVIVLAHVIMLTLLGLLYCLIDADTMQHDEPGLVRFFKAFHPKNIKKHIMPTDVFFFAFLVVCTISTIFSLWKKEAFFGHAGRYQGLECMIFYFLSYIAITRTYVFKKWHFDVALIAVSFACIWGYTDFLGRDIYGFFSNVTREIDRVMFMSSVGNLNTFTNYTGMGLGLAAALFCCEKDFKKTIFYGVTAFLTTLGCICGIADNAVLSIVAIYSILPFFVFNNRRGLTRYIMLIAFLFITFVLIYFTAPYSNTAYFRELKGSFFMSLIKVPFIRFMTIPITLLAGGLTYYFAKVKKPVYLQGTEASSPLDSPISEWYKKGFMILLGVSVLFVLIVVIDLNITHNEARVALWQKLPSYNQFIFNDDWGTHRGHNWRIAITNFKDFSLFNKLFGYGPDTYLPLTELTFYQEMVDKYGEIYDSAHNEYLNFLVCQGLLGLIAYLGTFITAIKTGFKYMKNNQYVFGAFLTVIAYMVQAIVNIAIPITTPIFFTFMYMLASTHFNKGEIA